MRLVGPNGVWPAKKEGLPGIFRVGSAVLLTPIGDSKDVAEWGTWPARVMKMRGMEMEVVLEGDGPEGVAIQHLSWTVDARADERSYKAMAHALSHWINVEDESLKAFRNAVAVSAWPQDPHPDDAIAAHFEGLNAPTKSCGCGVVTGALDLVARPSRTGKTKTLVTSVSGLVAGGEKILAAAPSNMAVDVLVERLGTAGLNVVRVGHPMRVSEHVLERTLDARCSGNQSLDAWSRRDRKLNNGSVRPTDMYGTSGQSSARHVGPPVLRRAR